MDKILSRLTEQEQKTLKETRYSGGPPDRIRQQIQQLHLLRYGWELGSAPVPTATQYEALEFFCSVNYRPTAFFIEQGLGKTKTSCLLMQELLYRGLISNIIVISPASLKYQWAHEELPKHYSGEPLEQFIWENKNSQKYLDTAKLFLDADKKIFFVNAEAFSRAGCFAGVLLQKIIEGKEERTFVVLDESTTIKNYKPAPKGKNATRKGANRANSLVDTLYPCRYKLLLSGTASANSPLDLWGQFELLYRDFFQLGSYANFAGRYAEMVQVKRTNARFKSFELLDKKMFLRIKKDLARIQEDFGEVSQSLVERIAQAHGLTEGTVRRIGQLQEYSPYKNIDELKNKMRPVTFFRRADECEDLPEKIYTKIVVPMSSEQKRLVKELTNSFRAILTDKSLSLTSRAVLYIRIQQIAGGVFPYSGTIDYENVEKEGSTGWKLERLADNPKLEALKEYINELGGEKIIVWAWFREEQELIYENLKSIYKEGVTLYRGKEEQLKEFKEDGQILVSGASAAFGLNLQFCNHQIFYSNNHRADIRDQMEKRTHRIGQNKTCFFADLVLENSKDEDILQALKAKLNLIDFFRSQA